MTSSSKPRGRGSRRAFYFVTLAVALVLLYVAVQSLSAPSATPLDTLVVPARFANLQVFVTERGELESIKTVDGVCEVEMRDNKIIFIVPEGNTVKEGDVVVRFDTAEIDQQIAKQEIAVEQANVKVRTSEQEVEIQRNKGESEIKEAELTLVLADLDLAKYIEGDFKVEVNDMKGKIALAESNLEKINDECNSFRTLVKKGFRTPEQLRTKEQQLAEAKYYLERDKHKLTVLSEFDYRRKTKEFEGKAAQSRSKLAAARASAEASLLKVQSEHEAAKSTLALENAQLEKLRKQKDKCVIKAQQEGVVAYANEDWWDSSRRIREGSSVWFRQTIFKLPDMSRMQVKVNVHESVVKTVKKGQKAEIRIDAFSNVLVVGTVDSVSPLADSSRSWARGGVKEYTTVVSIDRMPAEALKPGMTAEVKVLVNRKEHVLVVPVQAVTEHAHEHYVYVRSGSQFERRKVTLGENNRKEVEVASGLKEGEDVALDARTRGLGDFKDERDSPGIEPSADVEEEPANGAVTVSKKG